MTRTRAKIGFWAGDNNNFNFLEDIIEGLSDYYDVEKRTISSNKKELSRQLDSVDLAWIEWSSDIALKITKSMGGLRAPLVNRLHRYEAYTNYPAKIDYSRFRKLIFIAPGVRERFMTRYPSEYKSVDSVVIPNGVNLNKFNFEERNHTSKLILYAGRIHEIKNPSLMLQIMSALVEKDPEYKLIIIGNFRREVYEEYVFDQIHKLGLSGNVELVAHMPREGLVEYMQKADYFLISSIIEGVSQASLEAMACGCRPVISNYFRSECSYPNGSIYNTVEQAVSLIMNPTITRRDARDYVEKHYNLDDSLRSIKKILDEILESEPKSSGGGCNIFNEALKSIVSKSKNIFSKHLLID